MLVLEKVLNQVQSSGTGTWEEVEELGTLAEGLKAHHEVSFSNKNLAGDSRVIVLVYNSKTKDAPLQVSCSKSLSTTVRKALKEGVTKRQLLAGLVSLRLVKNEVGIFIVPEGTTAERIGANDLKKEETVSWSQLAGF